MSARSFRNRLALCAVLTLTALLPFASAAVQAQKPAVKPPMSYEELNKHYEETHKSVLVTVDYVNVSLFDLMKTSQWIPTGPQHDALLLAALVKAGAHETPGTSVQAWDGETVERGIILALETAPTDDKPAQCLSGTTRVVPHFNADGTITISLELKLDRIGPQPVFLPAWGTRPAMTLFFEGTSPLNHEYAKLTVNDGQTVNIGNGLERYPATAATVTAAFVRVEVTGSQEIALKPGIEIPSAPPRKTNSPSANPPSIDPRMFAAGPRLIQDPDMVVGLGTKPGRLDHMNILPAPISPTHK